MTEVVLVAVGKILVSDPVNVGGAGVLDVNFSVVYKRSEGGFVDFAPVLVDSFGWHWSCGLCLCGTAGDGVCVLVQQARCVISNVGQLMLQLSSTLLKAGTLLSKCSDRYTFIKVYIAMLEFVAFVLSSKKVYRSVHFYKSVPIGTLL